MGRPDFCGPDSPAPTLPGLRRPRWAVSNQIGFQWQRPPTSVALLAPSSHRDERLRVALQTSSSASVAASGLLAGLPRAPSDPAPPVWTLRFLRERGSRFVLDAIARRLIGRPLPVMGSRDGSLSRWVALAMARALPRSPSAFQACSRGLSRAPGLFPRRNPRATVRLPLPAAAPAACTAREQPKLASPARAARVEAARCPILPRSELRRHRRAPGRSGPMYGDGVMPSPRL